jgi:hypothetical protein
MIITAQFKDGDLYYVQGEISVGGSVWMHKVAKMAKCDYQLLLIKPKEPLFVKAFQALKDKNKGLIRRVRSDNDKLVSDLNKVL